MGAYVICDQVIRDYLVNKMRPLIFSTALPPFNVAWTHFVFQQLPHLQAERAHLAQLSQHLRQAIVDIFQVPMPSESCIVPYILGDNELTVRTAQRLQQQGYYCLPIRPPTVPKGTSRIRFSLTADMQVAEVEQFIACLRSLLNENTTYFTARRQSDRLFCRVGHTAERGRAPDSAGKL